MRSHSVLNKVAARDTKICRSNFETFIGNAPMMHCGLHLASNLIDVLDAMLDSLFMDDDVRSDHPVVLTHGSGTWQ